VTQDPVKEGQTRKGKKKESHRTMFLLSLSYARSPRVNADQEEEKP